MPEAKLGNYLTFQIDTKDICSSQVSTGDQPQTGKVNVDVSGASEAQALRLIRALERGMEHPSSILPLIVAWVAAQSPTIEFTLSDAAAQLDLPEAYIIQTLDTISVGKGKTRSTDFYLTPILSRLANKEAA